MSQSTNATVGLIAHNYTEQMDVAVPLRTFREAGFTVHLLSANASVALQTLEHVSFGKQLTADRLLSASDPSSYDAIALCGGIVCGDALRNDPQVLRWIAQFIDSEKPLAAIGYGVWALVSADAVEGLRLTSAPGMKTDAVNAGGEWVDLPVVVDHMILTCRGSSDIGEFSNRFMGRIRQYAFMNTRSMPSDTQDDHSADSGKRNTNLRTRGSSGFVQLRRNNPLGATEFDVRGRVLQPSSPNGDDETGDTY